MLRYGVITLDNRAIQMNIYFFLHENICCRYSLEVPQRGASNKYPQHMFSWINKNIYICFLVGKNNKNVSSRTVDEYFESCDIAVRCPYF